MTEEVFDLKKEDEVKPEWKVELIKFASRFFKGLNLFGYIVVMCFLVFGLSYLYPNDASIQEFVKEFVDKIIYVILAIMGIGGNNDK